jgi:hypothetical protein
MNKDFQTQKKGCAHHIYKYMAWLFMSLPLMHAGCSEAPNNSAQDRELVIENLASALEESFVFPEIALRYSSHLRKQTAHIIKKKTTPEQFADILTSELQSIQKDAHLRIFPPDKISSDKGTNDPSEQESTPAPAPTDAIEAKLWLTPDIAYIRFNLFPGDEKTLLSLDTFISGHANAGSLIIDVRGHRGGGLDEMDLMFSHMFSQETDLLYLETRRAVDEAGGSPIKDSKTVLRIAGPKAIVRRKHIAVPHAKRLLADTKLYILTSGYTASAAEHFALAMKRTKRGVVIGQPSRGGAHFGGTIDLSSGYAVFIPVGRSFNPDTGKDWEGVGVIPNIPTAPENALIQALIESGINDEAARIINLTLNYKPPTPSK